jgi:dipeptidyl aminopeptidase/acylaminoacyl peptidase
MRSRSVLCLAAILLLSLPAVAGRPITLDDVLKYKNITAVEISPDGRRAVLVVSQPDFEANTLRTNIYVADLAVRNVFRLTSSTKHDDTPRWSPDGKWIAFISDRPAMPEKAGKKQVWLISTEGGEASQLTRGTFEASSLAWAPDGRSLALIATPAPSEEEEKKKKDKDDAVVVDKDQKLARIHLVRVADGNTEVLYSAKRHVKSLSFSPAGDEIAFADQPTPKVPDEFNSVVRAIQIASKEVRELAGGDLSYSSPRWSPDGKLIAMEGESRTDWAANSYIYLVPAAGGAPRKLTGEYDESIEQFRWADDSASLYFTGAQGVDEHVWRVALDGKIEVVDGRPGVCNFVSVADGAMAWTYDSPTQPRDLYYATLGPKPAQGKAVPAAQLTPAKVTDMNPQIAELNLARTEIVNWKNKTDGKAMEGLLMTPADFTPGKTYPLLLVIHGGPAGVFDTGFSLRRGAYPLHVFAAQGYVIFLPNPRGSGGYGEKFRKANLKDWGYGDYRDIQDGVDELIIRGIADKNRMGVMGWSYGGYMTSWTITQTDRFKAASIGAGVTNLFSMWGTTDIPPFMESYFGAKPWEDRELMAKHSAMAFLGAVKTPALIQHGAEDRRVPYSQGEEIYTGLRARGVPTELIQYPRQPHGLQEPKLIRDAMQRNLDWFERYVLGNASAAAWHTP